MKMTMMSTAVMLLILFPVCTASKVESQCDISHSSYFLQSDGWVLAFRLTTGINVSFYDTWLAIGRNDDDPFKRPFVPCGCLSVDISKSCDQHYRSTLLDTWPSKYMKEVRVSVYERGEQRVFVTFNGTDITRDSWFSLERVLDSSWTDLRHGTTNFFSIAGDTPLARRMFINNVYAECPGDVGWLVVKDFTDACQWGTLPSYPAIIYSRNASKINYNSPGVGYGDVLAVWIKFKDAVDLNGNCLV